MGQQNVQVVNRLDMSSMRLNGCLPKNTIWEGSRENSISGKYKVIKTIHYKIATSPEL